MSQILSHIASLAGRRPRVTTLAVLLLLVTLMGGAIAIGGSFKDDFTVPGIESQKTQDMLEQRFPTESGTRATVVFTTDNGGLREAGAESKIGSALAAIGHQPHVTSVEDPYSTPDRISDDGRTAYAHVSYD